MTPPRAKATDETAIASEEPKDGEERKPRKRFHATGADAPATRVLVLVPVPRIRPAAATGETAAYAKRGPSLHSPQDRLAEAKGLAEAIDLDVVEALIVPLPETKPATLLGSGKVEEIGRKVETENIGLVVVDHALTPVQQRNLEKAWKTKVVDRTGLILEIFGARARTREGRLQVELAHLTYQKGRLVRAWTHLERQRGGAGFLGGPGEAQIELDRRMLQDRIDQIKRELVQVVRTRELHRAGRRKVPYPVVAIVGYTNAGKSTLFNRVTGAGVLAKDQVFATLDPTMREVKLASGRRIILSDTVGFISDLPTMLVAAFRATLEEVVGADLVLHVRDIAHAETDAQRTDVEQVLKDLGLEARQADSRIIEVWNKVDLLAPARREEALAASKWADVPAVPVSAVTGEGIESLLAAIDARLGAADEIVDIVLAPEDGRLLSWLHANGQVLDRATGEDERMHCRVRIAREKMGRLQAMLAERTRG